MVITGFNIDGGVNYCIGHQALVVIIIAVAGQAVIIYVATMSISNGYIRCIG
mgnify:CR=1 FL=1